MNDNPHPTLTPAEAGQATPPRLDLPPSRETAIAVIVAPERMDEVVPAIPVGPELLGFIWWLDEVIRRANLAKKYALAEAAMALDRGELLENSILVGGHRFVLKQDERVTWQDVEGLLYELSAMGVSISDIGKAVSDLRVTTLREAATWLPDDSRDDALETIEAHRVKVPTQLALVDIDSVYRRGR